MARWRRTGRNVLTLSLIGIGCGDPEQLTLAAIGAINAADLILIPRKGEEKTELAELRREICARVLTNRKTKLVEFDLPVRDAAREDYRGGLVAGDQDAYRRGKPCSISDLGRPVALRFESAHRATAQAVA